MQNKGYPADWLYQLKQKNNIVSIIGRYVHLEKKGGKFWACCPFHNEKTPSFTVNEDEGFFYCFGCKESGDVISFIMKYESCDFSQAVNILAKNANMEVPEFNGDKDIVEKKNKRDRVLKLLDELYKHYQQNLYLKEAKPAQEYVKKRAFTRHELEDFKIGYSLDWTEAIDYLTKKGFTYNEMVDAGVAQFKNNHYYDVMAQRLIFPIFNSFNECIGFSARILVPTEYAKYKNTAETIVFQKGRVVFGINLVKALKQREGLDKIIIVEGQIDVIAMHRAGFKNTVACMGTALTKENAHELKKLSNKVCLCFDGDGAGIKATKRSIDILDAEGFEIRVVSLPEGKDPDEIIKEYGKEKIEQIIDNALAPTDYLIETDLKNFDLNSADERGKFVSSALSHISKLKLDSAQEPYIEKLKKLTNIPIDILRRDLEKIKSGQARQEEEKTDESVLISRENGNIKAIKFILGSLIYNKSYVDKNIDYKKLLPRYKEVIELAEKGTKISSYFDYLDIDSMPLIKECLNFDPEDNQNSATYFNESLWSIASNYLLEKQKPLFKEFNTCQDETRRQEIMLEINKINKQLKGKNLEEFYGRK